MGCGSSVAAHPPPRRGQPSRQSYVRAGIDPDELSAEGDDPLGGTKGKDANPNSSGQNGIAKPNDANLDHGDLTEEEAAAVKSLKSYDSHGKLTSESPLKVRAQIKMTTMKAYLLHGINDDPDQTADNIFDEDEIATCPVERIAQWVDHCLCDMMLAVAMNAERDDRRKSVVSGANSSVTTELPQPPGTKTDGDDLDASLTNSTIPGMVGNDAPIIDFQQPNGRGHTAGSASHSQSSSAPGSMNVVPMEGAGLNPGPLSPPPPITSQPPAHLILSLRSADGMDGTTTPRTQTPPLGVSKLEIHIPTTNEGPESRSHTEDEVNPTSPLTPAGALGNQSHPLSSGSPKDMQPASPPGAIAATSTTATGRVKSHHRAPKLDVMFWTGVRETVVNAKGYNIGDFFTGSTSDAFEMSSTGGCEFSLASPANPSFREDMDSSFGNSQLGFAPSGPGSPVMGPTRSPRVGVISPQSSFMSPGAIHFQLNSRHGGGAGFGTGTGTGVPRQKETTVTPPHSVPSTPTSSSYRLTSPQDDESITPLTMPNLRKWNITVISGVMKQHRKFDVKQDHEEIKKLVQQYSPEDLVELVQAELTFRPLPPVPRHGLF
jgi:hypothetical protein